MRAALRTEINRLLAAHGSGRQLCLFFDYDGTLVPIADRPELARLSSKSRLRLERLARLPGVSVAVLSGRALDDIKRMVGLPSLNYAGTSGLELELAGVRLVHPGASTRQALLGDVTRAAGRIVARYAGAWIECKPLGLTLHYRGMDPTRIGPLRTEARQALQSWANDLRILDGPMAIEVTLALGWTKGSAIRKFLDFLDPSAALLYAGEGANDADALTATVEHGGVAVGIGAHPPEVARHRLSDPAALLRLLDHFLERLDPDFAARHRKDGIVPHFPERTTSA